MFISSSPHYINTVNEKTDEERGRCYLVTLPRIAFKVIAYKSCGELGLGAGPVMGGWHLRMTWGQEVNSEPASALSSLTHTDWNGDFSCENLNIGKIQIWTKQDLKKSVTASIWLFLAFLQKTFMLIFKLLLFLLSFFKLFYFFWTSFNPFLPLLNFFSFSILVLFL